MVTSHKRRLAIEHLEWRRPLAADVADCALSDEAELAAEANAIRVESAVVSAASNDQPSPEANNGWLGLASARAFAAAESQSLESLDADYEQEDDEQDENDDESELDDEEAESEQDEPEDDDVEDGTDLEDDEVEDGTDLEDDEVEDGTDLEDDSDEQDEEEDGSDGDESDQNEDDEEDSSDDEEMDDADDESEVDDEMDDADDESEEGDETDDADDESEDDTDLEDDESDVQELTMTADSSVPPTVESALPTVESALRLADAGFAQLETNRVASLAPAGGGPLTSEPVLVERNEETLLQAVLLDAIYANEGLSDDDNDLSGVAVDQQGEPSDAKSGDIVLDGVLASGLPSQKMSL
jgi:hypothetical protein